MGDQKESRIEAARQRASNAKLALAATAVAGFFAVTGFAASSHPGSSARTTAGTGDDGEDPFVESDELDSRQFGFFGSIAPSGGGQPQVRSSVS